MVESVILSTPLLWLLFGLALAMCLFDKATQSSNGMLTAGSAVVTVVASAVALILGASTGEVITAMLMFFLFVSEGWK